MVAPLIHADRRIDGRADVMLFAIYDNAHEGNISVDKIYLLQEKSLVYSSGQSHDRVKSERQSK
jgi:hypothetical protein